MASPFLKSFAFAAKGVALAFEGRNFRVQLGFAVASIVLGLALGLDAAEWAAVLICIGAVLGGECMNTAVEALTDLASPEQHPLAARAKDCAAGAVLLASIAAFAVGCVLFIPKILCHLP